MVVKNPLEHDLEIQYEGIAYRVAGNGETKGVPEEVAKYWKDKIHQFIEISDEAPSKAAKIEAPAPVASVAPATPTPDAEPLKSEAHKEVAKVEKKTAAKKK